MTTQPYSYSTFADYKTALAQRLYDPGKVFWTDAELALYIQDALRTWNALTSFWRDDFLFSSVSGQTWYDLPAQAAALAPYTTTDQALYTLMQYHLLEPPSGLTWTGSKQFSISDFANAASRRLDEIIGLTACRLSRITVPAVAGRTILPDTVIDVRRLAYLPALGNPSTIYPEDTWGEQSFDPLYTLNPAGTPETYLLSTEPPISFDVNRPPGAAGSYEAIVAATQGLLPTSPISATLLQMPDNWAHVLRWGVLADLLNHESYAKDVPRATYCEQRYRMGLKLLSQAPALLALRVNNVPLQIDSVRAADDYDASWQSEDDGPPTKAYYAGLNLLALAPAPDIGPYSLSATVVENAPLPVVDLDPIPVARDIREAILDYAQHVAAFKQGGAEFTATLPLLESFLNAASTYGLKLAELGEFTSVLYGLAQREDQMNPRMAPASAGAGEEG